MRIDSVLILAGGKGTRSLDPSKPKICQPVSASRDVASFIVDQLSEFHDSQIIWLVSHFSDEVIQRISPLSENVEVVLDGGTGTASAIREVSQKIKGPNVMILLGDCIMGVPLKKIVDSLAHKSSTIFFGRETDHPEDSDALVLSETGEVASFQSKGSHPDASSGLFYGLSGITITNVEVLQQPIVAEDFQLNIYLNSLKLRKSISLVKNSWYVRDTGTPNRLHRVQMDFASGSLQRRARTQRPAIFLDRDGTLIPNIGEKRTHIAPGDVPHAVTQEMMNANQQGIPLILVTNQPGIAKGFLSYSELLNSTIELRAALGGAFFDDFYFCPHHPEKGWAGEVTELKIDCNCRKPKPGMLLTAAEDHDLNLSQSFLIGDSLADMAAASSAGAKFVEVEWSKDGEMLATALRSSIKEITYDLD